jgi:hypothetical protein
VKRSYRNVDQTTRRSPPTPCDSQRYGLPEFHAARNATRLDCGAMPRLHRRKKKYAVSGNLKGVEVGCGLKTHSGSTEMRTIGKAGVVLAPAFFYFAALAFQPKVRKSDLS